MTQYNNDKDLSAAQKTEWFVGGFLIGLVAGFVLALVTIMTPFGG